MLRDDPAAAGIDYETVDGRADFHALRAAFVTNLARARVHPSTMQKLARHSDSKLTLDICSRINDDEKRQGMAALEGLAG